MLDDPLFAYGVKRVEKPSKSLFTAKPERG